VRQRVPGGRERDEGEIFDEWRNAAAAYRATEGTEADVADAIVCQELPQAMHAPMQALLAQPAFQRVFSAVPVSFAMVELDRLVACQCEVDMQRVEALQAVLGPTPDAERLFRFAMAMERETSRWKLVRQRGKQFEFSTPAHDFRYLGARVINPKQIADFVVKGAPEAVVAIVLGHSTNQLNAVRYGKRIALNNGYHRAVAMRAAGITHAPCVVQVVTHDEELGFAGMEEMASNAALYFKAKRPPVLRDFFDARFSRDYPARVTQRWLRLKVELETIDTMA
jgi:hypothetical protein